MCPRAAGAGLQVAADKSTDLRDSKGGALLSSPAAFTVPGEQRPPPTGGRDLRLPRHQGRRAPSCAPARCAAPRAPQAAPPLLRPAPPLRPARPAARPRPARPARWRRRPEAPPPRPAFVPSRPRASHRAPRRSRKRAGAAGVSTLGAATLAPATASLPHFEPNRRASGGGPGEPGRGSQAATASLPGAPAL